MQLNESEIQLLVREYQDFLLKLSGIMACSIIMSPTGAIQELHVLASQTRNPKQLVRDIQSALMAKYQQAVDHKVISIAQIQDDSKSQVHSGRLVCDQVRVVTSNSRCEVGVTLSRQDQQFEGTGIGSISMFSRQQAIATAVLDAVHQDLGMGSVFSLLDVRSVPISNLKVYLVSIQSLDRRNKLMLFGAAHDENDDDMAVVKATLDAINRRIAIMN